MTSGPGSPTDRPIDYGGTPRSPSENRRGQEQAAVGRERRIQQWELANNANVARSIDAANFRKEAQQRIYDDWCKNAARTLEANETNGTFDKQRQNLDAAIEKAQGGPGGSEAFPETIAKKMRSDAQELQRLSTAPPGILLTRIEQMAASMRPLAGLHVDPRVPRQVKGTDALVRNPDAQSVFLHYDILLRSYQQSIGAAPFPQTIAHGNLRPGMEKTDANVWQAIRVGAMAVAAIGLVTTGIMTLLAKKEDRNWVLLGLWGAVFLGAGYSYKLFEKPEEKLYAEIAPIGRFYGNIGPLGVPGGVYERLARGYTIQGSAWGDAVEAMQKNPSGLHAQVSNPQKSTDESRKTLAENVSDDPSVQASLIGMMKNGMDFADFVRIVSPSSTEAKAFIIQYVRAGANATVVSQIAQTAKKKAGAGGI